MQDLNDWDGVIPRSVEPPMDRLDCTHERIYRAACALRAWLRPIRRRVWRWRLRWAGFWNTW